MKNIWILIIPILISCSTTQPADTIMRTLFNDLSGSWSPTGDAKWTVDNGIISSENGLGYAVTTSVFDNFILEADFYPGETMNSGIFIRCPEDEITATGCYEINIADNHENPDFRTGSVVMHGKPLQIVESINKWNRFKIMAKDNRIGVWIDGIKTADIRDGKSSSGKIALQVNGDGKIQFKNVVLTKLN